MTTSLRQGWAEVRFYFKREGRRKTEMVKEDKRVREGKC